MSIKEISRRSFFDTDDYGISGIDVATAEIVIEDNGHRVYLLAQWTSEAANMMHFESTFESTYDLYEKMIRNASYWQLHLSIERANIHDDHYLQ